MPQLAIPRVEHYHGNIMVFKCFFGALIGVWSLSVATKYTKSFGKALSICTNITLDAILMLMFLMLVLAAGTVAIRLMCLLCYLKYKPTLFQAYSDRVRSETIGHLPVKPCLTV